MGIDVSGSAGPGTGSRRSRIAVVIGAVVMVAIAALLVTRLRNVEDASPAGYVARPVTATIDRDSDPSWSADGKLIAFARITAGELDIYVKPIKKGSAAKRAGGPGDQLSPRWAPDGRWLAYVSSLETGASVFLMPAYGGDSRELIKIDVSALPVGLPGIMGDRPWAPDGTSLLVTGVTEQGRVAILDVDGETGRAEQVTFPPAGSFDSNATYSFDGERILFRRQIAERGALMIMPAEGGEAELLHQDELDIGAIAWRPDNRHVVFHSIRSAGDARLVELDVTTRESRDLFSAETLSGFSISAMDRIVYSDLRHDSSRQEDEGSGDIYELIPRW